MQHQRYSRTKTSASSAFEGIYHVQLSLEPAVQGQRARLVRRCEHLGQQLTQDLPAGKALDIAAGEGRNALGLDDRDGQVTAVDYSEVAPERARAPARGRLGPGAPRGGTPRPSLLFVLHRGQSTTFTIHVPTKMRRLLRQAGLAQVRGVAVAFGQTGNATSSGAVARINVAASKPKSK